MNNDIEYLTNLYKPYKITIKGNVTLLDTTSGIFACKKKNKSIEDLYSYLNSRSFNYYPELIKNDRVDVDIFKYIEDTPMPVEQKSNDLIKLVALLHNKTTYFKEVSSDTYQSIYENILNNILDIKKYYNDLFDMYIEEEYLSPSKYLFTRNFYKIDGAIEFSINELDNWFKLIKDKNKQRVCVIHNNLSLDHYLKNTNEYLISWDKSRIDSPILDIIKYYKDNYLDLEFETILETYLNNFNLLEEELKLLFICISIPNKIDLNKNEFNNVNEVRKSIDYIFKAEKLIRPYYSKEKEEK